MAKRIGTLRKDVLKTDALVKSAERAVEEAAARLRLKEASRAKLVRGTDPRRVAEALEKADAEITALKTLLADSRQVLRDRLAELHGRLEKLGEGDPRKEVGDLDGSIPLLFLPMRLETRFRNKELWLRIYPDQWAVDSFEERLTETEVASVRLFWSEWWRAAGEEDRRRTAWRGLVASVGSGRAAYLMRAYAPLNSMDEPKRNKPGDVVLILTTQPPGDAGARKAIATYWEEIWRAGPDGEAQRKALGLLAEAIGLEKAEAVAEAPPFNLTEATTEGLSNDLVIVAHCVMPSTEDVALRAGSWTKAARAHLLPERFVATGFLGRTAAFEQLGNPIPPSLVLGPDPSAAPDEQMQIIDGELKLPDELRWLVDFDAAVKLGMAMRIKLDAKTERGVDRLFVAGLRMMAPEDNAKDLETLLRHHAESRGGFEILRQGVPTNNTEAEGSGFDREDDADVTFDRQFKSQVIRSSAWEKRQDGQWLADTLGIPLESLATVRGADARDQAEARDANTALWPATGGYFLDTMMHPVFGDRGVEIARSFFVDYVSGRGMLPGIRIGKQPYGILPTTAFSRLDPAPHGRDKTLDTKALATINGLLQTIASHWKELARSTPSVGRAVDGHQTLLDILALHPASVEFHQRYAKSLDEIANTASFYGFGSQLFALLSAIGDVEMARMLLDELGWSGDPPDILEKFFHGAQHKLKGPVIDDRPLSEAEPVRAYCDDGRNYLHWLSDAARTSLDMIRRQQGFSGNKKPTALLYLLLRHALQQCWHDAGLRIRLEAGAISESVYRSARKERVFVHVSPEASESESRYQALYQTAPAITGNGRMLLADHIVNVLGTFPTRHLTGVIDAIRRLSDIPTARLERVLAEHLDCCSHRFDAWRLGMVRHKLVGMRSMQNGVEDAPKQGLHVGCYGWLHDVRPEPRRLTPAEIPKELQGSFEDGGEAPMRDSTNGGFVLAPSLNHAATAAIMRSGYLANTSPGEAEAMAVNISSDRMRRAQGIIQGIRNGQPLGTLLGYQFERGLHDRHSMAEVDWLIRAFRLAFPSPSDRDGRLVMDGLDLVNHIEKSGIRTYPFGRADLPAVNSAEAAAVNSEVDAVLDVNDAVADLALAEGVHQAVLGNVDRAAATFDAYSKGGFVPEPALLETPRGGPVLTHRVGLHLRAGLSHELSPVVGIAMTPRAMAEPAVNEFLASQLPMPSTVAIAVSWTDRQGIAHDVTVTQADLGLQPIDLIYLLHLEGQAMNELDERILRHVIVAGGLTPDVEDSVSIHFTRRLTGFVTFFELASLVTELRTLLMQSRPLKPSDVSIGADLPLGSDDGTVHADAQRPLAVSDAMQNWRNAASVVKGDADFLAADPVANLAAIRAGIDALVDGAIGLLSDAGRLALPASGWADLADRRRAILRALFASVAEVTQRWLPRLAEADSQLARDNALPATATDEERNRILILAELAVRPTASSPLPTDADAYRAAIVVQRDAFAARLAALANVAPASTTLSGAVAAVEALLPLTGFDKTSFDLAKTDAALVELVQEVGKRLAALVGEAERRIASAATRMAEHDAAPAGKARVEAWIAASKALLGEDMVVVPEFDIPTAIASQWQAAMGWSRSGDLTAHLAPTRAFPVDDWLHGVARVRVKMHALEQAVMLAPILGRPEAQLTPIQLPHASEPWVGLEYPDSFSLSSERLLYTAHYPEAFSTDRPQCALLVDEWTETIPEMTQAAGLAFHHDSPDCEASQVMLLMTPPTKRGWAWPEIMEAMHDTLDMAEMRAVEPSQVDATPFAAFLPATVMAATVSGISIATNLAVNNDLFRAMGGSE